MGLPHVLFELIVPGEGHNSSALAGFHGTSKGTMLVAPHVSRELVLATKERIGHAAGNATSQHSGRLSPPRD